MAAWFGGSARVRTPGGGPGSEHVNGRGPMVNPAKLAGGPRDSVCIQCHLEGEARIAIADRTQDEFSPGEEFADHVAIFVREGAVADRLGAVSQVEALASSACRRGSGAAMSCLTCHDPHVQPGAARRADYYRAKCIGCHREIAATHQPSQTDCTSCHMPRVASADIAHTMVTDHRIVRTAQMPRASARPRQVLSAPVAGCGNRRELPCPVTMPGPRA